jgi:hypothetical protein
MYIACPIFFSVCCIKDQWLLPWLYKWLAYRFSTESVLNLILTRHVPIPKIKSVKSIKYLSLWQTSEYKTTMKSKYYTHQYYLRQCPREWWCGERMELSITQWLHRWIVLGGRKPILVSAVNFFANRPWKKSHTAVCSHLIWATNWKKLQVFLVSSLYLLFCRSSYEQTNKGSGWSNNADYPVLSNLCVCVRVRACGLKINKNSKAVLYKYDSPWAGQGRDQSSVRHLVWLWYAASLGVVSYCFPPRLDVPTFATRCPHVCHDGRDPQRRKVELWARILSGNFAEMTSSTPFRDLLHAANLRHGTDGFT